MGKDHTNISSKLPYEFPGGKCAADYKGENYKEILEDEAPQLDMGSAPDILKKKGASSNGKEKAY